MVELKLPSGQSILCPSYRRGPSTFRVGPPSSLGFLESGGKLEDLQVQYVFTLNSDLSLSFIQKKEKPTPSYINGALGGGGGGSL